MNWVDVIVLTVVAFSGMLGFFRGMVREVLGLAAWVLAAICALFYQDSMTGFFRHLITNPDIADPLAFGIPFLVILIIFSLLARLIGKLVLSSVLGGLDRSLGVFYGLARGAALVIAAYIIAGIIQPADQWPNAVLEARTLPSIYLGAAWSVAKLPDGYRPALSIPPAGRPPSSADLLHANPAGRALAAPSSRL